MTRYHYPATTTTQPPPRPKDRDTHRTHRHPAAAKPLLEMAVVREHSWEAAVGRGWDDSASTCSDDPAADDPARSVAAASEKFVDELLALYTSSTISAQKLCTLCYWATMSGMRGSVTAYAKEPGAQSGAYQRFLDGKLGFRYAKQRSYLLQVPGLPLGAQTRGMVTFPVKPLRELAERALADDPTANVRLQEAIERGALPPAYFSHPVVRGSPAELVTPWSIYMDSVAYSLVDSVLGVWFYNVITGHRMLVALVRKRLVCTCGCRGWCTCWPLLRFVHWSAAALASGQYPLARHDGTAWGEHDAARAELAGQPLAQKGAILMLKGDWAEFCERLGFPTWASGTRPCFCCAASGEQLFEVSGISAHHLEWHLNTDEEYDAACSRCEVWVEITEALRREILPLLAYDRRRNGANGRALYRVTDTLSAIGLRAGDRLEPCETLRDVGLFETMALPARVLFWRQLAESICRHRCPLLDPNIGITAVKSVALDLLHTLYLGPLLAVSRHSLWLLIDAGIWGALEMTDHERISAAVFGRRGELMAFYSEWERNHPDESLTRLSDLRPKMLGTREHKRLKVKAAESYGLAHFCVHMLQKHSARIGGEAAVAAECAETMLRYVRVAKASGVTLSSAAHEDAPSLAPQHFERHDRFSHDLVSDLNKRRSCRHRRSSLRFGAGTSCSRRRWVWSCPRTT